LTGRRAACLPSPREKFVPVQFDVNRDLFQNVGYLIRRTHQIADAIFDRAMREQALTPVQYGILMAVLSYEGIDQYQLGQVVGFDRTTISYVVRKLVAKGLIRTFKETRDRRSNLLAVTESGRALLAEAHPIARACSVALLEELAPDEREQLVSLLNKIVYAHDAQATLPRITSNRRAALVRPD
jgi:MarR family transcriptional regulator, lower aerobic nicotinate degradation pathway regulator